MTSRQAETQEDLQFRMMRILQETPEITQRELANKLQISVGRLNYCLNALVDKGFVKIENFQKSKNKLKYAYLLTPQGMAEKMSLTNRFMKRKIQEFGVLKMEIEALKAEVDEPQANNSREQAQ